MRLNAVIDAPEVVSDVFGAAAGEELRGLHPALARLWKPQPQVRARAKASCSSLRSRRCSMRSTRRLPGSPKPLSDLERTAHYVVDDIAAVGGHKVGPEKPLGRR